MGESKVLAFGDSLTAGVGATAAEAYPAQLAGLIRHEVINAGISGETSAEGRARLPEVLDEFKPQLVILCEGGNDMLRKMDRAAMRANLAAMIDEIRSRGMAVMLIGVPEPTLGHLKAAPEYAELAAHYGIPVENAIMPEVLSDRARKSDEIHPNPAGYKDVATAVAALMKRAGAVSY
jgi:lysophospholipase L1-like esterase